MRVDEIAFVKPPPPPARESPERPRRPGETKPARAVTPDRWEGSRGRERARGEKQETEAPEALEDPQEEAEPTGTSHLDVRA